MLAAVKGYYDGKQIVMDEEERKNFEIGDEVVITVIGKTNIQRTESREEKRKQIIDFDKFVMPSERGQNVDEYMKEMRENDNHSQKRDAFARLEQLRRKGTVVEYDAELVSYREEKYGR